MQGDEQEQEQPSTSSSEIVSLALPPILMRNLGDRSYDKRKSAAMEVENLIKQLQEGENKEQISAIIEILGQDFAYVYRGFAPTLTNAI